MMELEATRSDPTPHPQQDVMVDIYHQVLHLQQQASALIVNQLPDPSRPGALYGREPEIQLYTLYDLQVDTWTQSHQVSQPDHIPATPTAYRLSTFRWLWHLFQGATLLGACLAVAAWIVWKKFGQHWWYLQQQRAAQAIEDMSNEDLHRLLGGRHLPAWINFPDYQRVQWVNDVVGEHMLHYHSKSIAQIHCAMQCSSQSSCH